MLELNSRPGELSSEAHISSIRCRRFFRRVGCLATSMTALLVALLTTWLVDLLADLLAGLVAAMLPDWLNTLLTIQKRTAIEPARTAWIWSEIRPILFTSDLPHYRWKRTGIERT